MWRYLDLIGSFRSTLFIQIWFGIIFSCLKLCGNLFEMGHSNKFQMLTLTLGSNPNSNLTLTRDRPDPLTYPQLVTRTLTSTLTLNLGLAQLKFNPGKPKPGPSKNLSGPGQQPKPARGPKTRPEPKPSLVGLFTRNLDKTPRSRLLAVDFDDFYHQHSFGFHAFGTILL